MAKRGRVKRCVAAAVAKLGISKSKARLMCKRYGTGKGRTCPTGYHVKKKGPGAGTGCTRTVHRK